MAGDSIYKVVEIIGSSPKSWEEASKKAIETAAKSLRDIRIGEVIAQDLKVENGKVTAYRSKIKVSFKYEA